jgi:hypothetical protein
MGDVGLAQHAAPVDVGAGGPRRRRWDEGDVHAAAAPSLGLPV